MKWLLITCFLITLSNCVIRVGSDKSDENNCYEQFYNQSRREQICKDQVYNDSEFRDAAMTTLVQYSGDNDAVRAFADKYCSSLYQLLECTLISDAVDEGCLFPNTLVVNQQTYNIAKAMLDYVCANNATAVLLRVLESNGVHTIYKSKQFFDCRDLIRNVEKIDEQTLLPTAEVCDGLDIAFQCYADYVRDHENKNLSTMANEISINIRQAIKCSSTSEL